jgi:hypothetical protein
LAHHCAGPDESPLPDSDPAGNYCSGGDVHVVVELAVMLYDRARIDDDIASRTRACIYDSAGENHSTSPDYRVARHHRRGVHNSDKFKSIAAQSLKNGRVVSILCNATDSIEREADPERQELLKPGFTSKDLNPVQELALG